MTKPAPDQPSSTPIEPGSTPLRNAKWEAFARFMMAGLTLEDAYQQAGYRPDAANAKRLADRDQVHTRIDWLKAAAAKTVINSTEEAIKASGLDREWVLKRLMKNAAQALGEMPTKLKVRVKKRDESPDKGGLEIREIEIMDLDRTAANKALELLGKEVGLFNRDAGLAPAAPGDEIRDVPDVVEALDKLKQARKLVVVEGGKKAES